MSKIEQVNNGDSGAVSRAKINNAAIQLPVLTLPVSIGENDKLTVSNVDLNSGVIFEPDWINDAFNFQGIPDPTDITDTTKTFFVAVVTDSDFAPYIVATTTARQFNIRHPGLVTLWWNGESWITANSEIVDINTELKSTTVAASNTPGPGSDNLILLGGNGGDVETQSGTSIFNVSSSSGFLFEANDGGASPGGLSLNLGESNDTGSNGGSVSITTGFGGAAGGSYFVALGNGLDAGSDGGSFDFTAGTGENSGGGFVVSTGISNTNQQFDGWTEYYTSVFRAYSIRTFNVMFEANDEVGLISKGFVVNSSMSTHLQSGMDVSINADPTKFDVAPGVYYVIDSYTDPAKPKTTRVEYAGSVANTVDNLATQDVTSLGMNAAGAIVQESTTIDGEELRDLAAIGSLVHQSRVQIDNTNRFTGTPTSDLGASIADAVTAITGGGSVNKSGSIKITPNGANLFVNRTAGTLFRIGVSPDTHKNQNEMFSPPATGGAAPSVNTTWLRVWSTVDGDGFKFQPSQTSIIPGEYDDGTATQADALPQGSVASNRYAIHHFYYEPSSDIMVLQLGVDTYSSISDAEGAAANELKGMELPALNGVLLIGHYIVKGNTTELDDPAVAKILDGPTFRGASGSGGGATSTTTWQRAIENSTQPQAEMTDALGALQIKSALTLDASNVLEILNNAGSAKASISGDGGAKITTHSRINDFTDNTKQIAFDASQITTGNTHTITVPDRDLDLRAPAFDSLTVDGAADSSFSARVGIGTATPSRRLQTEATQQIIAHFLSVSGSDGRVSISNSTTTDDTQVSIAALGDNLRLYAGGSVGLSIDSNQNIGVGTTLPSTKMHVEGPIKCKSYTVATVPSASSSGDGSRIYVTDLAGGAGGAESDGTNWRDYAKQIIST